MGYRCDVRFATTEEGYKKILAQVAENYDESLKSVMDKGKVKEISEDGKFVTVELASGITAVYDTELSLKPHIYKRAEVNGKKFILAGWDDIKWMGYSFPDQTAYEKAFRGVDEPVYVCMVGEDGATSEESNDAYDKDYDSIPFLGTYSTFDYGVEWKDAHEQD